MAAAYRASPSAGSLEASTNEPVCTTTPSAPIWAARLRLWASTATDFSYVDAVGEPRLTRYGAWMNTRIPASLVAARKRASSAGVPAEWAQPRGLPTKIWTVSQPSSTALAKAPAVSPLPTWTWVPIGLRVEESTMGETLSAAGDGRAIVDRGRGQIRYRTIVLPLG